jgi:FlaA1/EpsC-like NDP-sugar epimerase
LQDKSVFVTGCCGTIGQELVRQLIEEYRVDEVIGIDNNESELFFLEQRYATYGNARFALGDVRDRDKLIRRMKGVDIVFHVAAFKHVILCERSPFEAVQTNIFGVQNIIHAAHENNVEKVIFTSSDKAVNPTSVMGTSKLMGERLMTAANSNQKKSGPVLRFIMSISEAVRLVIDSHVHARGGEVFITKMPVLRIKDLAEVMIEILAPKFGYDSEQIEIKVIGAKPGEKLYEELMSGEETRRAMELKKYFVVLPAFRSIYKEIEYSYENMVSNQVGRPYISEQESFMTQNEIKAFLEENDLIVPFEKSAHPAERYWP